jgi:hypothetical protein
VFDLLNKKKIIVGDEIEEWETELDKNNYEIILGHESNDSNDGFKTDVLGRGSISKNLFKKKLYR